MGLQGVKKGYKELKVVTKRLKGLHRVKKGYRG